MPRVGETRAELDAEPADLIKEGDGEEYDEIEPPAIEALSAARTAALLAQADAAMVANAMTARGREAAMVNYDRDRALALRLLGFEEEAADDE